MNSEYTVVCRHCGRRNSKQMHACSNCGKPVELPLGEDDYYQSYLKRFQFTWYHDLGIKDHRRRGFSRSAQGVGLIVVGIFFMAIFSSEKLLYIGFLPAVYGLSLLVVGLFEVIANRSFSSVEKQWQRELILLGGTLLLLAFLCVGIIYIPLLFD